MSKATFQHPRLPALWFDEDGQPYEIFRGRIRRLPMTVKPGGRHDRLMITVRHEGCRPRRYTKSITAYKAAWEAYEGRVLPEGYWVIPIRPRPIDLRRANLKLVAARRAPWAGASPDLPPLLGKLRLRPEDAAAIRASERHEVDEAAAWGVARSTVRRIRGMTDTEFRRYTASLERLWAAKLAAEAEKEATNE